MDDNKFRKRIAGELAYQRTLKMISQDELAKRMGTSKSSISRFEQGKENATLDYISRMIKSLNMEYDFSLREPATYLGETKPSEYELRLFDTPILLLSLKSDLGFSATIEKVLKNDKLPIDLIVSDSGLSSWIKNRTIPKNREMVFEILKSVGLNQKDVKGIIDVSMGLSLNDSYWIVPKGFSGKYNDYNLYDNPFSEALALVAYTGIITDCENNFTSPEFTTNGMLRKAWQFSKAKGVWLYKGGSSGFANSGNEPYSEFYASQIANAMGLSHVDYELENWKGILASKCKLFTSKDLSYIPIGNLLRSGGIEEVIDFYKSLGDEFYDELSSMLVFDCIIMNEDRHFGNFGLMVDSKSQTIVSPAPIFDNGLSLLSSAMKYDFEFIDDFISKRHNTYGDKYDYFTLAKMVMGKKQREEVRKLIGFKFTESDVSNLPQWRLRAIENILQDRVKELLK